MTGVFLIATAPMAYAAGNKKKGKPDQAADSENPAGEAGGGGKAASQSQDQERPKPILDEDSGAPTPEAPKADAQGNVNFGSARAGKGKITVKAPPDDKIKVYLEGRYFGAAPRTIQKVPPGDYIIELVLPGGKRVTKAVSVSSDEEAVVEIGGGEVAAAAAAAKAEPPMSEEQVNSRWRLAKLVGFAGAGIFVVGIILGSYGQFVLQKNYDDKFKTPVPPASDTAGRAAREHELEDMASTGGLVMNSANVCFILGAAGIITAAVIGYPAYKARKAAGPRGPEGGNPDRPPSLSFWVAPDRQMSGGMANLALRF